MFYLNHVFCVSWPCLTDEIDNVTFNLREFYIIAPMTKEVRLLISLHDRILS